MATRQAWIRLIIDDSGQLCNAFTDYNPHGAVPLYESRFFAWDIAKGPFSGGTANRSSTLPVRFAGVAVLPDGQLIAVGDSTLITVTNRVIEAYSDDDGATWGTRYTSLFAQAVTGTSGEHPTHGFPVVNPHTGQILRLAYYDGFLHGSFQEAGDTAPGAVWVLQDQDGVDVPADNEPFHAACDPVGDRWFINLSSGGHAQEWVSTDEGDQKWEQSGVETFSSVAITVPHPETGQIFRLAFEMVTDTLIGTMQEPGDEDPSAQFVLVDGSGNPLKPDDGATNIAFDTVFGVPNRFISTHGVAVDPATGNWILGFMKTASGGWGIQWWKSADEGRTWDQYSGLTSGGVNFG